MARSSTAQKINLCRGVFIIMVLIGI